MEKLLKEDFHHFCKNLEENHAKILENNLVINQGKSKATASCMIVVEQEVGISRKIVDF